jgi:hypothetical protein
MEAHEQGGVAVDFDQAFDSLFVERYVVLRGDGHEGVGNARFRIKLGRDLPFRPSIVVLACRETKRFEHLGAFEKFVAPFARKETGEHCVVRLADHQQVVAVVLKNHWAGRPGCAGPQQQVVKTLMPSFLTLNGTVGYYASAAGSKPVRPLNEDAGDSHRKIGIVLLPLRVVGSPGKTSTVWPIVSHMDLVEVLGTAWAATRRVCLGAVAPLVLVCVAVSAAKDQNFSLDTSEWSNHVYRL